MREGNFKVCNLHGLNLYNVLFLLSFSVQRSDYLNTFEFMDKLAENLVKKQKGL